MSLIKPFSGIRPKKKFAKQVTSPNISYIDNYKPNKKSLDLIYKYYEYDIELYKKINQKIKHQSNVMNNVYNDKICIVSPYIKTENKLNSKNEVSSLFKKNETNPFL